MENLAGIFNNGSGPSHLDIGSYVAFNGSSPTTFFPLLQSGRTLVTDIPAISTAKGWG
jgi:hypothetical protein